jgi:hypothetical protein
VTTATAASIIERYEWLGRMPAVVRYCFGIFFGDACGGVVTYSNEYAENLGVWDRYDFTGRLICLSRGAVTHWAPPNTASRLIRRSMALLPPRYEVVTATVDERAGEIGTIYQACGFDFIGKMDSSRDSIVNRWDHALPREPVKARYFAFRGSYQRDRRDAIAHLIQPYPRRTTT